MAGRENPDSGKSGPRPVLRAISVRGFKSIATKQRLTVAPLTVLAGANSSGKTSIVQPLLLMKQTLEAPFDPGALLLDGPNVRFTSTEQMLSRSPDCDHHGSFSIGLEAHEQSIEVVFAQERGKGLRLESMMVTRRGLTSEFKERLTSREAQALVPETWIRLAERLGPRAGTEPRWVVQRERCFLVLGLRAGESGQNRTVISNPELSPASRFLPTFERFIHVPGLRGNPERTYKTTAVGDNFPGTFEPYVASVIVSWQEQNDPRLKQLGKDLSRLGLTWKAEARRVDETRVELRVGRLPSSLRGGAHDVVSIADVGFGVSQALPVIVALLVATPGQVVYVEQPEIHLHPRAQRELAGLLAAAANRGVAVIVETHSALLLREIQTLVARGDVARDDVSLNWFQRSPETGATMIVQASLDQSGSYGEWPEDFDEVVLEADAAYLDAAGMAASR